ncbi:DUF4956 domain-containing protein [Acidobacteriota bacterium]
MDEGISKWLTTLGDFGSREMGEIGIFPFLAVMAISLFTSLFIAYRYTKFYQSRATGSRVHWAFPLLGISITAIFITIQFSLPLSLGLLGALSIVRFRTPIKEPEEIGFILLVVAASLCCATFNLLFLAILLVTAEAGLWMLKLVRSSFKGRLNEGMVIITLPANEYKETGAEILSFLQRKIRQGRIDSITENNDESIVSYSFKRLEQDMVIRLQEELREIAGSARSNIFFNRSSEI